MSRPAGQERFPAEVAAMLSRAGWRASDRDDQRGRDWALRIAAQVGPGGRQHAVVGPAIEVYAEFGGLRVEPDGPGVDVAPSPVHLDPRPAVHTIATLATLGDVLGVPLSPIGVEAAGPGILAIDERRRVFVLDHGGDWYVGASIEQAISTLLLGLRPSRVGEDGSW
ncbi:SUKH-3 domain-containing protein [Micromonospora sp. LOL_023]|uniref:SUKH-3 domain-containing protein n=1 Tax=Micromonospora sp. LOL_023 TaxID=3345418 RepID=UPI003A8ABDA2